MATQKTDYYDRDGKLVRTEETIVDDLAADPRDAKLAALEEKLHRMGVLADAITPDSVTNLSMARTQMQEIKRVLQSAKKDGGVT